MVRMALDLQSLEPSRPFGSDEFHFSVALPGRLWLGEAPRGRDLRTLRELGITDIVNLTSLDEVHTGEREAAFQVHHFPFPDGYFGARPGGELRTQARTMMLEACQRLDELMTAEKPTYLHCVAGISRSPTVFMLWLLRSRRAATFIDAFRLARDARSIVSPNPELIELVRELEPSAFPLSSAR